MVIEMMVTGSALKRLRDEAELTQRELAELAGISQAHVAKIENGRVDPRLSTVNKILQVLTGGKGRTCGEIMTGKVITARPDDKILKVSRLMMRHAISQVPVIQDGRCIGIITEESIIKNLSSTIADEPVGKVMEPSLPSVPEGTGIGVIQPLLEHHPGVLVVRKGEVAGIITRSDL
ncbi:CBS domain-containing protein, partial [Candidatus Bathyarchaeota archaeon]|nr:CBS domain-containing protein [Candidatus Bathyarchaeota archaeon]NIU80644.1 CBS domain-containing protein [Candidatus Bathyarchaeota archaeon]NIV67257.1 CBS domain-containing protein [Candidatus Bathyarchaeota archaeon]